MFAQTTQPLLVGVRVGVGKIAIYKLDFCRILSEFDDPRNITLKCVLCVFAQRVNVPQFPLTLQRETEKVQYGRGDTVI